MDKLYIVLVQMKVLEEIMREWPKYDVYSFHNNSKELANAFHDYMKNDNALKDISKYFTGKK